MTPPYPIANTILNVGRGRLNDDIQTLQPISGDVLDNGEPIVLTWFNSAYRILQEILADLGYSGLKQDNLDFIGVPPTGNLDPATQSSLGFGGFNNGVTPFNAPALPQNLLRPYIIWERPNGQNPAAEFVKMDECLTGLPPAKKAPWNRSWEWRGDTIYLPGARNLTDIRIRFGTFFPDLADLVTKVAGVTTVTPWFAQQVPILRCEDAMAALLCAEVCQARQMFDTALEYHQAGEGAAQKILNRDSAQSKAIQKPAEYQKMQGRFTPDGGANTQPVKRSVA